MKRRIIIIAIAILTIFASCCAAAEASSADAAIQLKEKHEEMVLKAIQLLCRYGMDDCTIYQTDVVVERSNSTAWNILSRFDKGWFTKTRSRVFSDLRTDNWTYVSETEFCVDAYCNFTLEYTYSKTKETFPCAFHFCIHQTNAQKDLWRIYDFHTIPCEQDIETAARLTAENEGITVHAVNGKSFIGFMTVVDDPSRIFVGSLDYFNNERKGLRIDAFCEQFDALGGINGGAFSDPGGNGTGGNANGLVYTSGVLKKNHSPGSNSAKVVMGLDHNDKLIVGLFTREEIPGLNLRDALAFNQVLVANGEFYSPDLAGNFTTRTAIGQDADGRILLLTAKGRQPNSFGANFADLANVMIEFGAVTAGNLDGGTSTCLYMNNESIYSGAKGNTSRLMPTCFLIRKIGSDVNAADNAKAGN